MAIGETKMSTAKTLLEENDLYVRYGQRLEGEHQGKYIAISRDGRVIVDTNDLSVIGQAIQRFGRGNFIFRRIGYSYVRQVRWGHAGQQGLPVSPGGNYRA
jgi:hypothetical protein